jgi:hypothetical protein
MSNGHRVKIFVTDHNGPLQGATVAVFLAGYQDESGALSRPLIIQETDEDGKVFFWGDTDVPVEVIIRVRNASHLPFQGEAVITTNGLTFHAHLPIDYVYMPDPEPLQEASIKVPFIIITQSE